MIQNYIFHKNIMGNLFNKEEQSNSSPKKSIPKKFEQSVFILNNSDIKSYQIFALRKLLPHHKTRINDIIEYFHKNGTPRKSDDFSIKNFSKFYPEDDPFFYFDETGIVHSHMIIYNENETDINKIKIYRGDLNIKAERHGFGKLITPYYELIGIWKNNILSGWGRQSRCNGEIYEGRFENGLINGKGIYLDKKLNKYMGKFKDMKRWGKGKLVTYKFIYEGDFNNDKIEGNGKIKFLKSGIEYEGTFLNDNIEGSGKFKWINEDIYEGEVKNGKMHGTGIYKYRNGKIYKGTFEDGQIVHNENLKNSLNNSNINNMNDNEQFDYTNPFRKIDSLSFGNDEDDIDLETLKAYQSVNENNNVSKYQSRTYNYRKGSINEFKHKNDSNINKNYSQKFSMDNTINKKNDTAKNPELMLSTYRNFGFDSAIKK